MPRSLRLGAELEKSLDRYCAETGETVSHVIRESVAGYIARRHRKRRLPSTWDLGKDLFGTDDSQPAHRNASGRVKQLIGRMLREKHHR